MRCMAMNPLAPVTHTGPSAGVSGVLSLLGPGDAPRALSSSAEGVAGRSDTEGAILLHVPRIQVAGRGSREPFAIPLTHALVLHQQAARSSSHRPDRARMAAKMQQE
eukprot:COSAG03_NODE_134_length_11903_cov_30.799729_2_plen_107_part_00